MSGHRDISENCIADELARKGINFQSISFVFPAIFKQTVAKMGFHITNKTTKDGLGSILARLLCKSGQDLIASPLAQYENNFL